MSTSFVDYKGKGFWIDDDLLAIAVSFVYKALLDVNNVDDWLLEMRDVLKKNGRGFFRGFMDLRLDDFLTNEDRKIILSKAMKGARDMVIEKGGIYDVKELNNLLFDTPLEGVWKGTIETSRILEVINSLEMLVQGEINTKSADSSDYFFR